MHAEIIAKLLLKLNFIQKKHHIPFGLYQISRYTWSEPYSLQHVSYPLLCVGTRAQVFYGRKTWSKSIDKEYTIPLSKKMGWVMRKVYGISFRVIMVCRMWTSGEWNKMSRRGKVLKLDIILESFCHVKQVHLMAKNADTHHKHS